MKRLLTFVTIAGVLTAVAYAGCYTSTTKPCPGYIINLGQNCRLDTEGDSSYPTLAAVGLNGSGLDGAVLDGKFHCIYDCPSGPVPRYEGVNPAGTVCIGGSGS